MRIAFITRMKLLYHAVILPLFITSYWISYKYTQEDAQGKFFVWSRVIFLLIAICMSVRIPPPGFGIGMLAVAAAFMTLHERQGIYDKAWWIFLVLSMLAIEARSILKAKRDENNRVTRERTEQESRFQGMRQAQNASFLATMEGINQSIVESQKQFDRTITVANRLVQQSSGLQDLSKENLLTSTGGDSFAYMLFNPLAVPPHLQSRGKYPLRDLRIMIMFFDNSTGYRSEKLYQYPALGVGQLVQLLDLELHLPSVDRWRVMSYFDAMNGHWAQETKLEKIDGEWSEAFVVRRLSLDGKSEVIHSLRAQQITEN